MEFNSCCNLVILSLRITWKDENICKALNKITTGCPNLREFELLGGCSAALHECLRDTLPKWTNLQSLHIWDCDHHIESFIAGTLPSLKNLRMDFRNYVHALEISNACPALEWCCNLDTNEGESVYDLLLNLVETCSNLYFLNSNSISAISLKPMLTKLGLYIDIVDVL
jgi:hypothetical protein